MKANLIGYTLGLGVLLYAATALLGLALGDAAFIIAAYLIAGRILAVLICTLEKVLETKDRLDAAEARARAAEEKLDTAQAKLDVVQAKLDTVQAMLDRSGGSGE